VVADKIADMPQGWHLQPEGEWHFSQASLDAARGTILYRADRMRQVRWEATEHGVTAAVEWEKAEVRRQVEVYARVDDTGRVLGREEVEVGELPDLEDPEQASCLAWEPGYVSRLRVVIQKNEVG